jgi:ketosteroid isomerase-like protein
VGGGGARERGVRGAALANAADGGEARGAAAARLPPFPPLPRLHDESRGPLECEWEEGAGGAPQRAAGLARGTTAG